jgi:hypothetical protein
VKGRPIKILAVEERLAGLRRQPVGGRHNVSTIETEAPGAFEITCSCGAQTWTPWGEAHAAEITALHLWAVGAVDLKAF